METVVLRAYRREDLAAMVLLDDLCFAKPFRFSRTSMRRFAEARNACATVAEAAGMLVGFCILHTEDVAEHGGLVPARAGYVVTLDVAPHLRRNGLATSMMEAMEAQAVEAGCTELVLHVSVQNPVAINFYERRGMTLTHTARDFYGAGLDAVAYRTTLGSSRAS